MDSPQENQSFIRKGLFFLGGVFFFLACGDEPFVDFAQDKKTESQGLSLDQDKNQEATGISLEEGSDKKEASKDRKLLTKDERRAQLKEKLSSEEAKEAFDKVIEKKEFIKASLEALCPRSSDIIFVKDEIKGIKEDDSKSKEQKIEEIDALLETYKERFEQAKRDRMSCLVEKKDEVGPLYVERRALKAYCGGRLGKDHKKYHKKHSRKDFFDYRKKDEEKYKKEDFAKERKKKFPKGDKDSYELKKLEGFEKLLLSEECQNLVSP